MQQRLTARSHSPDFLFATVSSLQPEPNTLISYESWQCTKADFLASHLPSSAEQQAFETSLATLLSAPTTVEWLHPYSQHVKGWLSPAVMGESIGLWVHLPTKKEQKERLQHRLLQPVVNAMQHEADFINTTVHSLQDDDSVLVLYEEWHCSAERFMSFHVPKDYRAEYTASLPEVLRSDRQVAVLAPIWTVQGKAATAAIDQ